MCVVNIWGSCVSRDVFAISKLDEIIPVSNFVQDCAFPIQFLKNERKMEFTIEDYSSLEVNNFFKKMYCYDCNKSVVEKINPQTTDWLILDMHVMCYLVKRINFRNGDHLTLTYARFEEKISVINSEEVQSVDIIDPFSEEYSEAFNQFVEFCKKFKNIILIEIIEASKYLDSGRVCNFADNSNWTEIEEHYFGELVDKLRPHVVKCPPNILATTSHKWGLSPVHYIEDYYHYAAEEIKTLISQHKFPA